MNDNNFNMDGYQTNTNDISTLTNIDDDNKKDDKPEPESMYLDKDKMYAGYSNDDGGPDFPPGAGAQAVTISFDPPAKKIVKEETFNPLTFKVGSHVDHEKEREELMAMREELTSNSVEEEKETISMGM